MNEQLQNDLAALDNSGLAEAEGFIKQVRAGRNAVRDANLPEFPLVVAVQGHQKPVQVTRSKCIELLNAGSHVLAAE